MFCKPLGAVTNEGRTCCLMIGDKMTGMCFSGLYGNIPVLADPDVTLGGVKVFRNASSTIPSKS